MSTDVRRVSMREATRIAKLAQIHGEPYLDQLLTIAQYAADDEVRRFAYEEFYKNSR